MKIIKKLIFILIIFLSILLVVALLLFNVYTDTINYKYSFDQEPKFTVNTGDSLIAILPKLEEANLIKNSNIIRILISLDLIEAKNIKPGKYILPKQADLNTLINIFNLGIKPLSTKITIPEGLTIQETADIIEQQLYKAKTEDAEIKFNKNNFIEISKNWFNTLDPKLVEQISKIIPNSNQYSLEGLLFPDTYEINLDWDTKKIITLMIENFFNRINTLGTIQFNTNVKNIYDAIILGSIIEQESSKTDKKEDISSVFHNRMNIGMPLQSDATINYITGKRDPGVLTRDTFIDSPYNTYKHTGLPIGPINSPGLDAIKAAIYPSNTPYYFFFHDKNGQGYFSVTYAEHQQKLRMYM